MKFGGWALATLDKKTWLVYFLKYKHPMLYSNGIELVAIKDPEKFDKNAEVLDVKYLQLQYKRHRVKSLGRCICDTGLGVVGNPPHFSQHTAILHLIQCTQIAKKIKLNPVLNASSPP